MKIKEIEENIRRAFESRLKEDITFYFDRNAGKKLSLRFKGLELHPSPYDEHIETKNWNKLQEAIDYKQSWVKPATIHFDVVDENNNVVASFKKRFNIPIHTFINTFILKGSMYIPVSQIRRLPGFYVVNKGDKYIAMFNIANKKNFKIVFDYNGKLYFEAGTKKINLKNVADVLNWNLEYGKLGKLKLDTDDKEKSVLKLASFFLNKNYNNVEEAIKDLREYFKDAKIFENKKTHESLPDKLTFDTLPHFIQYFFDVINKKVPTIDNNDLRFKEILNPYELMAERLKYMIRDGKIGKQLRKQLLFEKQLKPERFDFTTPVLTTFIGTGLIFPSQKVNIIDLANNFYKVIYTGEGGIKNTLNTDDQLRMIHYTDMGVLDPYFTPSSGKVGLVKYFTLDYNPLKKTFTVIDKNGKEKEITYDEFLNSTIAHIKDKDNNANNKS